MTIRIAINGYGRIGKNCLRALYESNAMREHIKIVAINDLGGAELNAHLTKYDSTHGRFPAGVEFRGTQLIISGDVIEMLSERDPSRLPWEALGVDIVLECTGRFNDRQRSAAHLDAGAKKVIISAPAEGADATVVFGVNHDVLTPGCEVISNASCTTNCLAPVAKVLHEGVGIQQGSMTTVHAYTNDQHLADVYHRDIYRARAAALSMIPTRTGAAKAVGQVLPELQGRIDGMAIRVPTANVSVVDLNFIAERETGVEEINRLVRDASEAALAGVLEYNDEPLVSVDFNHVAASSIFDATQTRVYGRWVKVMAWYDNEWGFANRMLDNSVALMAA